MQKKKLTSHCPIPDIHDTSHHLQKSPHTFRTQSNLRHCAHQIRQSHLYSRIHQFLHPFFSFGYRLYGFYRWNILSPLVHIRGFYESHQHHRRASETQKFDLPHLLIIGSMEEQVQNRLV